nr:energy-coupling factor ABC transporter permease [Marinobacter sp. X15-166B]
MTENLLPVSQWIITAILFFFITFRAVLSVNWAQLRKNQALQHSFFGAAVVLALLWHMRAGLAPGLSIHIFGITAVVLMLGWGLAVIAGLLALVLVVITGREPAIMFAANGLITVIIPALVSHRIMLWERRRGFRNFFAYIFVCGFFGAALAVAAAGVTMVVLLWLAGVYPWSELVSEYLRYLPLIMAPEGFVNGTVVTGLMVFHPERLLTLDVRRYR